MAVSSVQISLAETIEVEDVLVTPIQTVRVPARWSGPIVDVGVTEGEFVRAGETLAQIDSRKAHLAKARALLEESAAQEEADNDVPIRLMKKRLELAEADLRRAERARAILAGSIPDEEYAHRQLEVEKAELEIEQAIRDQSTAQHKVRFRGNDVELADLNLRLTQVTSPVEGVVVSVDRNLGEWVKDGDEVLQILEITRLRAEVLVDVALLTKPIIGCPVTLTVDFPDGKARSFTGTLRFESPEINPHDNRVKVWAEIENPDRVLRPGMRGRMSIELPSSTPVASRASNLPDAAQ